MGWRLTLELEPGRAGLAHQFTPNSLTQLGKLRQAQRRAAALSRQVNRAGFSDFT
jgi:hypothetical protein